MSTASLPEVWLRGPAAGFAPVVMPAAHALLQVREDLERLARTVPDAHVWVRPGGAASIGFHIRHTGGALDRLLTYARGEALSEGQLRFLRAEGDAGDPPASLVSVVGEAQATVDRALDQLRQTAPDSVYEARRVGRAGLPATVLGLIVHAAEHSTRHMGQAITTAKIMGSGLITLL
jgi:hypothetical protein